MKAEEVSSGAEVKSREVSSGSVVVVGGRLGRGARRVKKEEVSSGSVVVVGGPVLVEPRNA